MIGYGYWGPNLVRNFMERHRLEGRLRLRPVRQQARARSARSTRASRPRPSPKICSRNPAIDAVAIATPVATHFELAMGALRAGKHVLVEKPIASTSASRRRR